MEQHLELTIFASSEQFERWICHYTPKEIPESLMVKYDMENLGKLIFIGKPVIPNYQEDKYIKILGKPYLDDNHEIVIEIAVGQISDIHTFMDGLMECGYGDGTLLKIPLLTVIGLSDEKTTLKLNLQMYDLREYYKELAFEIARIWPETKRVVYEVMNPVSYLDMEELLFCYILEIQPLSFLDWLHSEIARIEHGPYIKKYNDCEVCTFLFGDSFPPGDNTPYWEYIIIAKDIKFSENQKPFEIFHGAVVRIEIRDTSGKRFLVRCFNGTSHPDIVQLLTKLKEEIKIYFNPEEYLPNLLTRNAVNPWDAIHEKGMTPQKRNKLQLIWELRNQNETWENIAERVEMTVNTVRKHYRNMKLLTDD